MLYLLKDLIPFACSIVPLRRVDISRFALGEGDDATVVVVPADPEQLAVIVVLQHRIASIRSNVDAGIAARMPWQPYLAQYVIGLWVLLSQLLGSLKSIHQDRPPT